MDVLGVQQTKKNMKMKKNTNKRRCKEGIKVVYISSPMKVKTCASKFRDLVQELTGKDSDTANASPFDIDVDHTKNSPKLQHAADDQDAAGVLGNDQYYYSGSQVSTESQMMSSLSDQSPSLSGSEMEMFDDVFMPHREGSFLGMFTSKLFSSESFQLDHAFQSFDSV